VEDKRELIGCLPLFKMAKAGADLQALAGVLLDRAKRNVNAANSLMDLSWIFSITGEEDAARSTQRLALRLRQAYHLPPPKGASGLRLLALMSAGEYLANTPLECLLEGSNITLDILFLGSDLPFPDRFPEHDLIFTAIRASDENLQLLKQLEDRLADHPGRVVNAPSLLPRLARDKVSALMQTAPGVVMPVIVRVARENLEAFLQHQTAFPFLVRAVGAHRGEELVKMDDPASISDCLQKLSASEFFVASYVDYRGPDGLFRKYRIVLIEGQPFASHLAISDHWMVNFINSHMELSPEKRAEEAAFMAHFDEDFACRHAVALSAIHERLGLDYVVLDCAESSDGRLLLFEADASAIVHANDPVDLFPYKQPQMRRVFDAFCNMLEHAAR
jgi:hypothetical protein